MNSLLLGAQPSEIRYWAIVAVAVSAIMWIIPITRPLVGGFYSKLLIPVLSAISKFCGAWSFWLMKRILVSHKVVMMNLISPRRKIYPSLGYEQED